MSAGDKIKINWDDIRDPRVDKELTRQRTTSNPAQAPQYTGVKPATVCQTPRNYGSVTGLGQSAGTQAPRGSILYSSAFYCTLAGALGAFPGWMIGEPFFDDTIGQGSDTARGLVVLFWFPLIGGLVGLAVGAVEGAVSRASAQAATGGAIGFAVGAVGGLIGIFAGGLVYNLLGGGSGQVSFAQQVFARGLAWAFAGMLMGLGQGIAMRSGKKLLNGFIGGLAGGLLGGLLFDPLGAVLGGAGISRCVGMTTIGAAVGLLTALAEQLAKDAWLHVATGPLTGKQFVIYKNPTLIGSSPKCDIYLFKDAAIEPRHASISHDGRIYVIQDAGTPTGTFVNGRRIQQQRLQSGDRIQLGGTCFLYSEKAAQRDGKAMVT